MKVGTDSVLLGCMAGQAGAAAILDIGSGTGLLALMMAQRFPSAHIDAVEIDPFAGEEAVFNVEQSEWSERIDVHRQSFQDFTRTISAQYDLIISNPPYYKTTDNVKITNIQRSNARHDGELAFEALLAGCSSLIKPSGSCWFILPRQESELVLALSGQYGFFLYHKIFIYSKASRDPNRVVICLGKTKQEIMESSVTIYNEDGSYTRDYFELTRAFLLWEKGL